MILENFLKLYLKSTPISKLSYNDSNFNVFSLKKGLPITLVETKKFINELYEIKSHYSFFQTHRFFWMIPLATPNKKIIGFILRGRDKKEYRIIFDDSGLPPMFGWESFRDFPLNKPIILCEGSKDAMCLQSIYPYSLSLNTSNITSVNMEILKSLTNKLVLCYDNDDTGIKSSKFDRDSLVSNGFICETIKPEFKDIATYFERNENTEHFRYKLSSVINLLGG